MFIIFVAVAGLQSCARVNLRQPAKPVVEQLQPAPLPPELPPEVTPPPPATPPPPSVTPPPNLKPDTQSYKSINPMTTFGCGQAYSGELEIWNLTTPISVLYAGVPYSVRVVGAVTVPNTCDRQTLDPLPPILLESRHFKFQGVTSFRIRTPAVPKALWFAYGYQNLFEQIGGAAYSISKIPGELDPLEPNSAEYCNLSSQTQIEVNDGAAVDARRCKVEQDAIYYINVFMSEEIPDDGVIDTGDRVSLTIRINNI